ncbi:MAG: hypothetical protein HDS68_10190 [Bacteroidales bacterium]|nr:hypothetical protein [Bacteroidales bacterium]
MKLTENTASERNIMKHLALTVIIFLTTAIAVKAQFRINNKNMLPEWELNGHTLITIPDDELWRIATEWNDGWMSGWVSARPESLEQNGEWTIVSGTMELPQGKMLLRDSYKQDNGLVRCRRRYEWQGEDTLHNVNLSVRLRLKGHNMQTFIPGVVYYGNKNGAEVNPDIIPVYDGKPGEFAIFEDHRLPMPFVMLENSANNYAATLHTTPSPVRGAVLDDQWWSVGVEAGDGYSDFVLYSGPIGYNRQHGVAKALQFKPMTYNATYLDMEPGRIIEKEFFIELYETDGKGTGFQRPIYTTLDLYKPYEADRFTDFETIVNEKYNFAKKRWLDYGDGCAGFNMYDLSQRSSIVMGWCGQADSPGYALQLLEGSLADSDIPGMIQKSMDFLSTFPVDENSGQFPVGYDGKEFFGGDPVSCGQAMYNFAKAISQARASGKYDTAKWEIFLRKCCDGQSRRILSENWNPRSTAEAFLIAPLAIASRLFDAPSYLEAAEKAARVFADRHLEMDGCYWGGTLDATCEDKEGAWAAFQGFQTLYELSHAEKYLKWAKHAMDVCLSYVVAWDIPMPPGRLADFNFRSTGWTVVSPQNQHVDVYGVLFAPEVYKMGEYLGDDRLKQLAKVMYRSCFQLTNAYGSQGEQLQHTNFAQRGDMSDVRKLRGGYSEGWTVFWITAHFLNAAARFQEIGVEP